MINGIIPCLCREPPALECGALCGFLERLDRIITFAHFSTEIGDLAKPFYIMMQSYVLSYGVEALGLAGIGLKITNGLVPLSIGMIF
jgi:hypothetical protein